jgi:hypothetical protein
VKVLIVSANSLPASPTGPAAVAGPALAAGHSVEVFECLFAHETLNLDHGLRGEADFSFPLFLDRFERGGCLTDIPGSVYCETKGSRDIYLL